MKKWEYMLTDFVDRKLSHINGVQAENFEYSKRTFLGGTTEVQGIFITDFLAEAGKDGRETVSVLFNDYGWISTILFKRE